MDSFLDFAAKQILNKTESSDFENTTIILPSKRAVYFFKKSFAKFSKGVFFAPKVLSIDEFLVQHSQLQIIDNVELYLKTFGIWKTIDENQSLDSFITWIPTVIKDFENIDFALLSEPHQLFKYMSEAKAIERWELEPDYQFSTTTEGFFGFFDKIAMVYEKLKNELLSSKLAYRGLSYRIAAEKITSTHFQNHDFHYFVGLNALTTAEETIVKHLIKKKQAECIWDTDDFYMNSKQKAGKKLYSYKKSMQFGEWNSQFSYLSKTQKNIQIFDVQSDNLQVTLTKNLLSNQPENHVVIVLDEKLFLPILYQIPNNNLNLNISIGLPVSQSRISIFIETIFRCYDDYSSLERISNTHLHNLFEDIHFKKLFPQTNFQSEFGLISKAFYDDNQLKKSQNEILQKITQTNDIQSFIVFLITLFEKLLTKINQDALDISFVQVIIEKLSIISNQISNGLSLNQKTFQILYKELLKNIKLPFESELESPIQIMSLLETRCLDFENVTFLSFSEGNLPSNTKLNSFIPNDAAYYFKLPVYEDQDAIMAYHFLRILQRAQNINFIYSTTSSKGVGVKEKSRFLNIIENQLTEVNDKIVIKYPQIDFIHTLNNSIPKFKRVFKTKKIIEKTQIFLNQRGLSATSINDYLSCSLRFYFKNIENFKIENEIEKNFGNDIIGQIVHSVLEEIDNELPTKSLKDLHLEKATIIERVNKTFERQKTKFDINTGLNWVIQKIVGKLLMDYYQLRINNFKEEYKVYANEITLVNYLNINELKVKLKGTIDKIEVFSSHIEIIDFKTGKVERSDLILKDDALVEESILEPKYDKLRQLLYYNWLFVQNQEISSPFNTTGIIPTIYTFRNLKEKLTINFETLEKVKNGKIIEKMITQIVNELMEIELSFEKTPEISNCLYCDYKNICQRE